MPPLKSEDIIKTIEAIHVIGEKYCPIIPDKNYHWYVYENENCRLDIIGSTAVISTKI